MATTSASTAEYDAFGPWVDEVRTAQDVPRLYRAHPLDLDAARLVLKVPRNISRRDATAEMDLYDHLVALLPDEVTVLSRIDPALDADEAVPTPQDHARGYRVWTARPQDVVAMTDSTSLLDGRLDVLTLDGRALTVRYNGSAAEGVQRLVDALRAAHADRTEDASRTAPATAPPAPSSPPVEPAPPAPSSPLGQPTPYGAPITFGTPATYTPPRTDDAPPTPTSPAAVVLTKPAPAPGPGTPAPVALDPSVLGRHDVGLVTAYRDLDRRLPGLRLLALHPRTPLRPGRPGAVGLLDHVLHAVSPAALQGAVVAADDRWIEVVGRRTWLTRGRAPELSRSRLTVARRAIATVHAAPHPRYAGVTQVTLVLGGRGVEVPVPTGSDAERVLLAARD